MPSPSPSHSGVAAPAELRAKPSSAATRPTHVDVLGAAVRALEQRRSISATVRQRIDLFGKPLIGSGSYLELREGPGVSIPLIRYELKIQIADQPTSLLQVCDGRYLWIYRKLLEKETVGRIDAVRALSAMDQAGGGAAPERTTLMPGLAGLGRLLRGLQMSFRFTSPEPGRVGNQPVLKLEGDWRPAVLARLLPKQQKAILEGGAVDLSKLPEHLPNHVVLLLGQEDLFPCRIEYCRSEAAPVGESPQTRALVTLELFEVTFDAPLDPRQFNYNPGGVEVNEQTDAFLQSLGLGKPGP